MEVRERSYGETRCTNQQKPKTKIKMKDAKKYQYYCVTCQTGCRISENIWSMKVALQSHGETLHLRIETLPVLLMNLPMDSRAKVEPGSCKHLVFTHFPIDPHCDICLKTKISRASPRRRAGTIVPRVKIFGDLITVDHNVLSEESESRNKHRYAVVVQDVAMEWLQSYPRKTKTSQETQESLMKFLEQTRKPKVIYTDNSLEFGKSCEELSWNHCTSTPHRSETNGIAERAVRRVKEGTCAVPLQPSLEKEWSAGCMECHCYLRKYSRSLV